MTPSREERLAAWLDGELTGADLDAFEAELASDPELKALADEWGANDALIAGAFAPVTEASIDPAMLERLGLGEPAPLAVPPPPPFPPSSLAANDNPPWWRRHALPLGGAIAASLVAAVVLAPRGGSPDRDPFSLALDRTPSLASAELPDGRRITPALTARAADGRWCREFGEGGKVAVACRDTKGVWTIEAQGAGGTSSNTGDYAVAAGADDAVLDAAHRRLQLTDPLDAAAEQALIANEWGGHPSR